MKKLVTIVFTVIVLEMILMGMGNFTMSPLLTGNSFLAIAYPFLKESWNAKFPK